MREAAERIRKAEAQRKAAEAENSAARDEVWFSDSILSKEPHTSYFGKLYDSLQYARKEATRNPNAETLQAAKEAHAAFQRGVARTKEAARKQDEAWKEKREAEDAMERLFDELDATG